MKGAYIVKCVSWETDENGKVTEVHCTYDPETKSGQCDRKVKGTLHWLSVADAVPAELRHYEPLMRDAEAGEEVNDFTELLNPDSLTVKQGFVEPYLKTVQAGDKFQFIRMGYYCMDLDTKEDHLVFNRVVGLKDSFKIQ